MPLIRLSGILLRAALVIAVLLASGTSAQPLDAPLRLVVPAPPGGGLDQSARILADVLKDRLRVPVLVENRSGADGRIAAQYVRAAPSSENVLLMANPSMMTLAPVMFRNLGYDPERDFTPLAQVRRYVYALAVGAQSDVRDMRSLIARLNTDPARANFGVPSIGSLPHLFALQLANAAEVVPQMIGYRGSAPLLADLIGGQVPVGIDIIDLMIPAQRSGKLRILAVSGARRSAHLPDVPTLREEGLPVDGDGWTVVFAPASMPVDRMRLVAAAISDSMARPDVQQRFRSAMMEPVVSTQQQTAAMLSAYRAKWVPIAHAAGQRE